MSKPIDLLVVVGYGFFSIFVFHFVLFFSMLFILMCVTATYADCVRLSHVIKRILTYLLTYSHGAVIIGVGSITKSPL